MLVAAAARSVGQVLGRKARRSVRASSGRMAPLRIAGASRGAGAGPAREQGEEKTGRREGGAGGAGGRERERGGGRGGAPGGALPGGRGFFFSFPPPGGGGGPPGGGGGGKATVDVPADFRSELS